MNVEYINIFIEASKDILYQTTGFKPKLSNVNIKKTPYKSECIVVLIGLTGRIFGSVVFSFNKEVACKIASAMMGGLHIKSFDELAKSAVAELCNMILGNTVTNFSKRDININITPPTVLTGENIHLSIYKSVILNIPFIFDDGTYIEMDISYIENKQ